MDLSNLKIAKGSRHLPKRVGQGIGSGMGKTSTRGQKGQGARQGRKVPVGFEGGQLPLYRRLPKHGFVNHGRIDYTIVDVAVLEEVFEDGTAINDTVLLLAGLIHNLNKPVKIIGNTEVSKKLNVTVQGFSKAAKASLEKVGGKAEIESLKDARITFKKTLISLSEQSEEEDK
jgi:large subunit ribosomal protein L15